MQTMNLARHAKKTVLLIEDDEESILLQRKLIERAGGTLHVAKTVEAGMEYLRTNSPDLVLTDLGFAEGQDGMQFLLEQGASGDRRATPVVVVSGHADTETKNNAARLGARGFIAKPFVPKFYEEQVARYMRELEPVRPAAKVAAAPTADLILPQAAAEKNLDRALTTMETYLLLTVATTVLLVMYASLLNYMFSRASWYFSF